MVEFEGWFGSGETHSQLKRDGEAVRDIGEEERRGGLAGWQEREGRGLVSE